MVSEKLLKKANRGNAEAMIEVASEFKNINDIENALKYYEMAWQKFGTKQKIWYEMAELYAKQNNEKKLLEMTEFGKDINNISYIAVLADYYLNYKNYEHSHKGRQQKEQECEHIGQSLKEGVKSKILACNDLLIKYIARGYCTLDVDDEKETFFNYVDYDVGRIFGTDELLINKYKGDINKQKGVYCLYHDYYYYDETTNNIYRKKDDEIISDSYFYFDETFKKYGVIDGYLDLIYFVNDEIDLNNIFYISHPIVDKIVDSFNKYNKNSSTVSQKSYIFLTMLYFFDRTNSHGLRVDDIYYEKFYKFLKLFDKHLQTQEFETLIPTAVKQKIFMYLCYYYQQITPFRSPKLNDILGNDEIAQEYLVKYKALDYDEDADKGRTEAIIKSVIEKTEEQQKEISQNAVQVNSEQPDNHQDNDKPNSETIESDEETLDSLLNQLNDLIGLENVKKHVNQAIRNLKFQKIREKRGLPTTKSMMHLVFTGNPGTGKTTVAKLVGKIYCKLGYLSKGTYEYVTRTDLVGEYVGHTGKKTKKLVEKCYGGVLFIDEAYSLASESKIDFGREAVAELITHMENHKDDLMVIVAGYTKEMQAFLDINPGLSSRFADIIEFEDYTPEELAQIFEKMLTDKKTKIVGYKLTEASRKKLNEVTKHIYSLRGKNFGNARSMETLVNKVLLNQQERLENQYSITSIENSVSKESLMTILPEDFDNIDYSDLL